MSPQNYQYTSQNSQTLSLPFTHCGIYDQICNFQEVLQILERTMGFPRLSLIGMVDIFLLLTMCKNNVKMQ